MITTDKNKYFELNIAAGLANLKHEDHQPDVTTYAFSSAGQLLSIVIISADQREKQRDTTIIPFHQYNVQTFLERQKGGTIN